MKKIIGAFFFALFLWGMANAENEITFNGLTWLSDDITTFEALSDIGIIRQDIPFFALSKENNVYIITDDKRMYRPDINNTLESACFSSQLSSIKGKVAGYPLETITLTYAYDGEYKLISIKIDLIQGDYSEIKGKIEKVYGEGECSKTEDLIESTIWKGSDCSAVLLYTESEGLDYTLMYGRLDAEEILSNCLAPADPDDVSGL